MYAWTQRGSRTDCFSTECLTHKWPGRARAFPKDLEAARPSAVIHSGGSFEVKDEVRAAKNGNPCTYPPLLCVRSCDRCGCSQPRRVQSISHTHPLTTFTPKMGFLPYHRSARTTNQHNMDMTKKLITMMVRDPQVTGYEKGRRMTQSTRSEREIDGKRFVVGNISKGLGIIVGMFPR